jgi:anti-sigma28 factor (negative regulator of flagellin synthesis)
MRIGPTNKNTPVGRSSPAQPSTPAAPPSPASADRVDLSALSQAASGLAPEKLEQIQAQVSAGSYRPDAAEVSHSIVDFYLIPLD